MECHKACLVAKGFNQQEGLDYHKTFAPFTKLNTFRYLLAVAAVRKWLLFQMNVNDIFLHEDLDEEVFVFPPLGLCR